MFVLLLAGAEDACAGWAAGSGVWAGDCAWAERTLPSTNAESPKIVLDFVVIVVLAPDLLRS
jgi:hypothetical protein